ncbi:L-threonylcarbamoyladenylate synthase [Alteromonas sp. ASW11-36]|uniref:Threonylcarbamoyl-AMP synthase n=1 Tax=Alteromonas arenosi TaxID=3055817 RepID=A0ABT7SZ88_9ALTE|nr:L-threonylcarbamoyladenylate synthase [Alteromonas sp. ASW11-36]MDM7861504.1 L-threonylcarbamoyladenylate synthase [Alteromonas sp. ASW11-36]
MNTQLFSADEQDTKRAAEILKAGGTVAVPTETVYGLAADAQNPTAVNKIFTAKQRPNNHPLIVHIHDIAQLSQICSSVPEVALELAEQFWPGPLTLILPKHPSMPDEVTGGMTTIGVRMPAHPVLRKILAEGDLVVAAPSANPHKQLSPTSAQQVLESLAGRIDAVVDGGFCQVGLESTIVDLGSIEAQQSPRVLRAGPITPTQLSAAIGRSVLGYQEHQQSVPGNIEQHYQPKGRLTLVTTDDIVAHISKWPGNTACLWYSDTVAAHLTTVTPPNLYSISHDKAAYAQALYRMLYEIDQVGYDHIWVEQPPLSEQWADVNDRLRRASA